MIYIYVLSKSFLLDSEKEVSREEMGRSTQIKGAGSGLAALEAKVVRICKIGTSRGQPYMGVGDGDEGS